MGAIRNLAAIVAGAMAAASPALAQMQCMPNNPAYPGAGTTCYNEGIPPLPQSGGEVDRRSLAEQCAGPHIDLFGVCRRVRAQQAKKAQERRDVVSLIKEGDCEGAINRALADDDFDTAQKAKNLCTPAARPSP